MNGDGDRFLEVFIDTNNRCNLRCLTCVFSDPRVKGLPLRTMDHDLFSTICRQVLPFAEYATLSCLTEPLMTRDFTTYLLEAGRAQVPRLEFVTNGLLLREEHLAASVDAGVWRVSFSVDGADAATYERIRQGASFAVFRQKFDFAVRYFARRRPRPRIRIIMTLIRENFLSVSDAVRQFIDWGVTEIELRETVIFPGIGLEARQLHDRKSELEEVLRRASSIAEHAGIPIEIISENASGVGLDLTGIPPCHVLERRVAITPNGDVLPCMLWSRDPLGSLLRQSFDEIWNGDPRRAFREEFRRKKPPMWCPTCKACKEDPGDEDAFFRLLSRGVPTESFPSD